MCEKPSISKLLISKAKYFDWQPRFLDEIQSFLFQILGLQIEIQGVSEICGNRIPYISYV